MKSLRCIILLLCLTLALSNITVTGAATTETSPTVAVTNYSIDPAIFSPGDKGTLTVTITNIGTSSETTTTTTTGVSGSTSTTSTLELKTKIEDVRIYSTSIKSVGAERQKRIIYDDPGALSPGESITLTFPIEADVPDGKYFPEIRVTVEDGVNVRYPVPITVDSSTVELNCIDIPEDFSRKSSHLIQLGVANTRPNPVNGVRVTPRAENFEFTPDSIFIGEMNSNEEVTANFTVTPLGVGVGEITFQLEYRNGDNIHTSTLDKIVEVVERDDLRVIVASYPESIPRGGSGTIELDIANGRSSDISSVRVIPIAEALTISPSEVFIGDMEQDDIFSAEFDIRATSATSEFEKITFNAVFRDLGNDKLYETDPVTVTIRIEEDEKDTPAFSLLSILVGLLIAGLIIGIGRKKGVR